MRVDNPSENPLVCWRVVGVCEIGGVHCMTQRSERAQHSSKEAEGCALHWPQPLEDEAYLIRWPWRSPQPRDVIGKEPRNIRIPTQENRVFWLLSAPHPARRDETCLGSTHTRTDLPIAAVRALCLSNPASKGRRWRRDASRAALLRFSQSFLTFVARPSLAFSPHYTNTTQHSNNNNPTFVVVDTPLHLCFLAAKDF